MRNSWITKVKRKLKFLKDSSWGNVKLFFNPSCRKSFSQCGEDLIVKHIFEAIGIVYPTYIDIGAHHPYLHSNTALFHVSGSRGINIEPDPSLFSAFPAARPGDLNLNAGIADQAGELEFFVMKNRTLNTFSREKAYEYQNDQGVPIVEEKKIPVVTLKSLIDKYSPGQFWDFMSIDVEGFELQILGSHDWKGPSPKVICCETISFSTSGKGVKDQAIIDFLLQHGYFVYADTHVNSIFVKKDIWEG
ncbi:MAG: FkbM family methyltransferase [Candidatus Rifleibacteriota bacterium]